MAQDIIKDSARFILSILGALTLVIVGLAVIHYIIYLQKPSLTETEKSPTSEISVVTKNSIVTINLTNSHTRPILVTLTYITSNCTHIKVTPRALAAILPPNTTMPIIFKVEKQTTTTCNLTFRLSETLITKRRHVTPIPYVYPAIAYRRGVEEGEEGIRGGEIGGEVGEGVSVGEG